MILMNDFKAEPAELREAMLGATRRVLESGCYVLGGECMLGAVLSAPTLAPCRSGSYSACPVRAS